VGKNSNSNWQGQRQQQHLMETEMTTINQQGLKAASATSGNENI